MTNVSTAFKQAVNAQETGQAFIILLTIDHPDFTVPIRVSSDGVNTESRMDTFIAFPFDLRLPNDSEDSPPRAKLVIDNVSREIILALRAINSPPTILMELVLSSNPDQVERDFPDFELAKVDYDAFTVSGDLTQEPFLNEPYPGDGFIPSKFPGLF